MNLKVRTGKGGLAGVARRSLMSAVLVCLLTVGSLLTVSGCSTSVDPREQVFTDYIQQQVDENGWTEDEIAYEDNGEGDTVFITFTPEDMSSQELVAYDDAMAQDEATALAEDLNSFVYILGYTSDDRLVSTVAAEPPNYSELDDETYEDAVRQLVDRQSEYVEFAQEHAEEWLGEYVANAAGYFEGLESVDFGYVDEKGCYAIRYVWSDGYCPVPDDQDAVSQWQYEADMISRATANNIVLLHGTRAGGLQTPITALYADNMLYGYYPSQMADSSEQQ